MLRKNLFIVLLVVFSSSSCDNEKQIENKKNQEIEKVGYEKKNIQAYDNVFPINKTDTKIEDFDITLKALNKILRSKKFSRMDDYMYSEMKTYVLQSTDSLRSIPPFRLMLDKHEQLILERRNDSTIALSVGLVDVVLGVPYYVFVLKGNRYKLFDIPELK